MEVKKTKTKSVVENGNESGSKPKPKTRPNINEFDYKNRDRVYINSKGYEFRVVGKKSFARLTKKGDKRWQTKYLVKFTETGFETWSDAKEIRNGQIRDWMTPYVCDVGVVGLELKEPQTHYLYDRWRDMLRRCYDEKCSMYPSYGAIGCRVCDEWKYFPNFVKDIEKKENAEKLKMKYDNINDRYEIDKDLIKQGNKLYCDEYVSIVTRRENMKERNERLDYNRKATSTPVVRFSFDFTDIKYFDSVSSGALSTGLSSTSGVSSACRGKQVHAGGYYWHYNDGTSEKDMIENIKNRNSGREIRVWGRKEGR